MTVKLITPADGEILQAGPIRMRVLGDGSGTAGRPGVVEIALRPGSGGRPAPKICAGTAGGHRQQGRKMIGSERYARYLHVGQIK
jgi:hypothetical protein